MIKTWLMMPIFFMSANYLQHCVYEKYQVPSVFHWRLYMIGKTTITFLPLLNLIRNLMESTPQSVQPEDLPKVELQLT